MTVLCIQYINAHIHFPLCNTSLSERHYTQRDICCLWLVFTSVSYQCRSASFYCAWCSLTKVHAVLVVALQQAEQQVPQMAWSLSGDAANKQYHNQCVLPCRAITWLNRNHCLYMYLCSLQKITFSKYMASSVWLSGFLKTGLLGRLSLGS